MQCWYNCIYDFSNKPNLNNLSPDLTFLLKQRKSQRNSIGAEIYFPEIPGPSPTDFWASNIAIHLSDVNIPLNGIFYGKAWKYLSPHNCALPSQLFEVKTWASLGYESNWAMEIESIYLLCIFFLNFYIHWYLQPSQSSEALLHP